MCEVALTWVGLGTPCEPTLTWKLGNVPNNPCDSWGHGSRGVVYQRAMHWGCNPEPKVGLTAFPSKSSWLPLVTFSLITRLSGMMRLPSSWTWWSLIIGVGGVEVLTKNILYWFMKGQTHFGMPRGAEMSLALHEPIQNVLCSNLHTNSTHAPRTYQTRKVL